MRTSVILVFLFAASLFAVASADTPTAPFQNQCSALGALTIVNTGLGRCFGVATAECKVHAKAFSEINAQLNALTQSGASGCTIVSVDAAASAVGSALAEVFVDAYSKVTCTGTGGFACGFSVANGFAWAQAYAQSIALAFAEALNGNNEAFCTSYVNAIANGIVSVLGHARADTCVVGIPGTAVAFSSSFSKAFTCVFSNAWVTARAIACNQSANCEVEAGGSATSGCNLVSSGTQTGAIISQSTPGSGVTASGTGTTTASAGFVPPCATPAVQCCFTNPGTICPAPWSLINTLGHDRVFRNSASGATCKCPF